MRIISVIVPVFNEEGVVDEFYKKIKATMSKLSYNHEIIYVNDGSRDGTMNKIKKQAGVDRTVKIINLSRNFGHQIAISAGIDFCRGDAAVIIDADLQDPPELISEMIEKWEMGYDVVYALRRKRRGEGFLKKFTAALFYRFFKLATEIDMPMDTGDFRLIDRKVIDSLKVMREKARFMRGLISWMGYKQIAVEYDRDKRFAGETKYPLKKMLRFAIDGVASFSFFPLHLISLIGMFFSIISFFSILLIVYLKLFTDSAIVGWASTMLVILFLGGVQLMAMGVIGEYIGRIFMEVKNRPLYLVRESINFDNETKSLLSQR